MTPIRSKERKSQNEIPQEDLSKCDPFFEGFPNDELKKYPKKLREACGDAYFQVDALKDFELRIGFGTGNYKVRRGGQLMRHHATYQLASAFFPLLKNPPPTLRFLLDRLGEQRGEDKVVVIFEKCARLHVGGKFSAVGRHQKIRLFGLPPTVKVFRLLDDTLLYHELGHSLMYHLYGRQLPHKGGRWGHDIKSLGYSEAESNPSAAWSEGFANTIQNLDRDMIEGGLIFGIYGPDDLSPEWFKKSLNARLSNEYVIAAILTDYVKSKDHIPGTEILKKISNEASYRRLNKIFFTMHSSGVQKDFGVFVRDFLKKYPEEGKRLNPILWNYGLGELSSDRGK